jgi:nucleoside-diphosphate-sugar epimerase
MQTILGAGGAIGVELAKALTAYTTDIRLVGRNPKQINATDTLHPADLNDPAQVMKAIEGSAITYLTVGYDYNTKLWQERWPVLIRNVVEACTRHHSKLVFFDNVYAIGGDGVRHITEASVINPSSKKGDVRAAVDQFILDAVERGRLEAIIARAPDFFGTIKDKSITMNLIYDNYAKGKKAQWLCDAHVPHSTGYTPDLALGTARLGNTPTAYNQIWNLPTDPHAPTGTEWAVLFAEAMNVPTKLRHGVQTLPGWGMRALGLFVPIMKEMYEMRYQYDRPYFFDSAKYNTAFGYVPTPNAEAVQQVVAALAK